MSAGIYRALVIIVVASLANGQYKTPSQLHPVHGLYVKPSPDGTTGDLYVAASEDSGSSQWLTDQPVNFLPVGAATQQHKTTVPFPKEESSTQKRAVISPPVQYAYALSFPGGTESAMMPYPYVVPASVATPTPSSSPESGNPCDATSAAYPYNPFQFFYPHLMSAYGNAKSILKESGMTDDKAGAVISQASPMWSPYGAYPMYVMVDPTAWAQMQAASSTPTTPATNES